MALEIERRFLVDATALNKNPWDTKIVRIGGEPKGMMITQGYLSTGATSVRIRETTCLWGDKPRFFELTCKGPGSLQREEISLQVDKTDGRDLLALCETRLKKLRVEYLIEGVRWEMDFFSGALEGLCIGEVEFAPGDSTSLPSIPEFCVREITGEKDLSNASLSKLAQRIAQARELGIKLV